MTGKQGELTKLCVAFNWKEDRERRRRKGCEREMVHYVI